ATAAKEVAAPTQKQQQRQQQQQQQKQQKGDAHIAMDETRPCAARASGKASDESTTRGQSRVYVLSASDSKACQAMVGSLNAYLRACLEQGQNLNSGDMAYTLFERKSGLPWKVAVKARNVTELAQCLEAPPLTPVYAANSPRLAFVFNGQGGQWHAMGRELISAYPVFASSVKQAGQVLRSYGATWSLPDELSRCESSTRVNDISIAQPISVALQLCLVDLLRSWGITAASLASHSSGEIAAAYAIHALTFAQALGVGYFQSKLASRCQRLSSATGGMLAVGMGATDVEKYTSTMQSGRVVIACINSPESVTLSGDLDALDRLAEMLEQDGAFARKLRVPLAYHSPHVVPMEQEYINSLQSILPQSDDWDDSLLFASSVTGSILAPGNLTAEHWSRNLTDPVHFSEAFEAMFTPATHPDIVVEIGPHSTLAGPIRQLLRGRRTIYAACLKRDTDAVDTMHDLICVLVSHGYPVNLNSVNSPFHGEDPPTFTPDLGFLEGDMGDGAVGFPACFKSHWEPDILHSIPFTVKESMKICLSGDEAELERKLLRCSFDMIYDAVLELEGCVKEHWAWHHMAMYRWMKRIVYQASIGAIHPGSQAWASTSRGIKQMRSDDLEASGACGQLTVKVGRALAAILRRELTLKELLNEDNLLSRYSLELPRLRTRAYRHLARIVELYSVKNPGAHVLEIGAGIGGATSTVLEAFKSKGNGSLVGHYTFTDISKESLALAQKRLAGWAPIMDFTECDIECETLPNSLARGTYDLIVASLALGQTKNLHLALSHVRQLLKPGGKLLFIEKTKDRLADQLVFGTSEAWWLKDEPFRKSSPNVDLNVWDDMLKSTGFSGNDFDIGDFEETQFQSCSVIISTALAPPSFPDPVTIIYTSNLSQSYAAWSQAAKAYFG
ncbi:acyl transferase domain-containing protein, partial [Xylariaceae sp. FL0804]